MRLLFRIDMHFQNFDLLTTEPAGEARYNQPPQGGDPYGGGYNQPPQGGGYGGYQQPPQGGSGYQQPPQGGSEPPTQQVPRMGDGWPPAEPPTQPPR